MEIREVWEAEGQKVVSNLELFSEVRIWMTDKEQRI